MSKKLLQALLLVAFVALGWVAAERLESGLSASEGSAVSQAEVTPPDAKPTDLPPMPDGMLEMQRQAQAYVPWDGGEAELEAFWEASDPRLEGERLLALDAELDLRLTFFTDLLAYFSDRQAEEATGVEGPMTEAQFYALFAEFGLRETRFLKRACQEGRMRIAPFYPLPQSVLVSTHPTCQLVPHISPTLGAAFLARLQRDEEPRLFADRPAIAALGEEILGAEHKGADALRARTRASLQESEPR